MTITRWHQGETPPAFAPDAMLPLLERIRDPLYVIRDSDRYGIAVGGHLESSAMEKRTGKELIAALPPLPPERLGDPIFSSAHSLRLPYLAGAMAMGIASADLVIALGRAGMLGFFGAAGLQLESIERALDKIERALGDSLWPWGVNLIFSPGEPAFEEAMVEVLLRRRVRRVCASAFMNLTPGIVRYACSGLSSDPQGRTLRKNHLFVKLSRPELAHQFLSPAPPSLLRALVDQGKLTADEAALAGRIPLAEQITVEADSAGHTDNRPLLVLVPAVLALRDELHAKYRYERPIHIGAAGGLGTPLAIAGAFAAGAAYVLTGSINQAARESDLSDAGKELLAQAGMADVVMAPAVDSFELGGKVQVLKRGTLFPGRAARLLEIYRTYESIDAIPDAIRTRIEREIFQGPLETIWQQTREFFEKRDIEHVRRAEREDKHRMALVFRWYLGMASRWAIEGNSHRSLDYQIWCGPAMGAFNAWVAGSFLEKPENRTVVQLARNLMEGAATVTRAQQVRCCGVRLPPQAFQFRPRPLSA